MNPLRSEDTGIPSREEVFRLPPDERQAASGGLQPFLAVKPPLDSRTAPPVLAFQRKREIDIPWKDIIGTVTTSGSTSAVAIREYFEKSWNVGKEELAEFLRQPAPFIQPTPLASVDQAGKPVRGIMYRTNLNDPQKPAAEAVPAGVVLRHATSGRSYLVLAALGVTLSIEDFKTVESYEAAWADKIDGVELVFEIEGEAVGCFTDYSEIDLRPAIIHRRYNELLLQKNFADNISASVAATTEKLAKQIVESSMDVEELERLQARSLRLAVHKYEAQRRLDRLVSQASDLGYYLFLDGPKDFTFPDNTKVTVKPGEMYTKFQRVAKWTTRHTKYVRRPKKFLGITVGSETEAQSYQEQHSQTVTSYSAVDPSRDPLADEVARLRQAGNEVAVFVAGREGFVTADGVSLKALMDRCEINEAFRRKCVVMLPVYEEAITGQRTLTRYSVFKRPLRGISPTMLPRLSLVESLSYRTAWQESRLGELLSSINLAPGEQRTVVLSKSFERETTVTRSATSIFDVSRAETSDLSTEMENQVRTEKEQSSNLQFSSSAEGSYGLFSAQASASGGTSASLKDFAQAIGKVAKRASHSINQQNRQEVTTAASAKATVTSRDETTATIRNINEGRSLNLFFYRLYNLFESGIYLDDLQFQIIPSIEIIAGSGVYEAVQVNLGDLPDLLEELKQSRLPFKLDSQSEDDYLKGVLDSLEKILLAEYKADGSGRRKTAAAPGVHAMTAAASSAAKSVGLLLMPQPAAARAERGRMLAADAGDRLRHRLQDFSERLRQATLERDTPVQPDRLLLVSDGLYLDTAVGALPSTEPYSEAMRIQEVRMRAAEVFAKEAEGTYQLALAAKLGRSGGAAGNWLTGILPDQAHGKTLALALKQPLAGRKWALLIDGEKKASLKPDEVANKWVISLSWDAEQPWLKGDGLIRRTVLMDEENGEIVGFPE